MAIDEAKLNASMGNFVHDTCAVMHAETVAVGDQLGLYKILAKGPPMIAEALATHTEPDPRYLREWLAAQPATATCNATRRERSSA